MSDPMIYEDLLKSISLQGLAFGHMPCVAWAGRTAGKSGQAPAHANLSARQAKEKGLLTSGTYGPPCIGWSGSVALSLSLASNLQVLTQMTGSTLYKLTWKPWVMPSARVRFRLRASVPRISETVLIGWPTPTANAWKHPSNSGRQGGLNLQTAAQLSGWTTPSASDSTRGGRGITAGMSGSSLAQQVKMAGWPTPTASDHKGGVSRGESSQWENISRSAGCSGADCRPGPVNGFWEGADWIGCTDGKWRPVKPGLEPLVDGAASRVGRIRTYGNALNAEAAVVAIKSYMMAVGL